MTTVEYSNATRLQKVTTGMILASFIISLIVLLAHTFGAAVHNVDFWTTIFISTVTGGAGYLFGGNSNQKYKN